MRRTVPSLLLVAVTALSACGGDDDGAAGTSQPEAGSSVADSVMETVDSAPGATLDGPPQTQPGGSSPSDSGTAPPTSVDSTGPFASAPTETTTASSSDSSASGSAEQFAGTLTSDTTGEVAAITYDPAQAPESAELTVTIETSPSSTTYALQVTGMLPSRGYAVHAHVEECGATGDAAGPHHQHEVDPAATPEQPSSDPAYANPDNEIWLDLRTDASGAGTAEATVPFGFDVDAPGSVVIHAEEATMTAPGEAGTAGDRVACLSTPLG